MLNNKLARNQWAGNKPVRKQVRRRSWEGPATKEDVEAYLALVHSKEMAVNMIAAMTKPMTRRRMNNI